MKSDFKKIFILGLGKTGTSLLANIIWQSLTEPKELFFEPTAFGRNNGEDKGEDEEFHRLICEQDKHILSKCLVFPVNYNWQSLKKTAAYYSDCIWIHRDPRDRFISESLYSWHFHTVKHQPKEKLERWFNWRDKSLEQLRKKETSPNSVPYLHTLGRWWNPEIIKEKIQRQKMIYESLFSEKEFLDKCYQLRYEDLVDGKLSNLESRLSLPLHYSSDSNLEEADFVKRSSGYGSWRDYFTEQDVTILKPVFHTALEQSGYDPDDWALNHPESIPSTHLSDFVLKISTPVYLQQATNKQTAD